MTDLEVQHSPERQRIISNIHKADSVAFQDWFTKTNPYQELPSTAESVRYLISPGVWGFVGDPARMDVVMTTCDPERIEIFVIEHMDQPLTNIESLRRYEEEISRPRTQLPADVDPFHWEALDEVLDGRIQVTDKIYNEIYLKSIGDELCVIAYGDRSELRGKGIATSFYQRLREVAKKLGFRYITGKNEKENKDFFKKKLGRVSFDQLPDDLQEYFERHHGGDIDHMDKDEDFTVDFLNPEDRPRI